MPDHRHESRQSAKPTIDETLSDKAQHVFEQSRDSARQAANRTVAGIDANPLGVVIGGVALGAVLASLVPRGQREREFLAPVGKRLSATAVAAIAAAKESGKAELEARGLTREGARDQAKSLFEAVTKAVTSAGAAAAGEASNKADADNPAGMSHVA